MEYPKNQSNITDCEDALLYLIEGNRSEQEIAFSWVYDTYLPNVTTFISSRLLYPETMNDVEDLVNETFVTLWKMTVEDKLNADTNLEALLILISKRTICDYFKKRYAKKRKPPTEEEKTDLLIDVYGDDRSWKPVEICRY